MNKGILMALLLTASVALTAQNPYLPPTAFIPDGEPHVFTYNGEQRVYVYGSRDEMVTSFCGKGHDVWSAPVSDLTHWTNHGEVFNVQQILDLGYGRVDGQVLFAPDCAYNPVTGKYYLYVFLGKPYQMDGTAGPKPDDSFAGPCYQNWGPTCFVAESDSPAGPFVNPVPCDWPTMTSGGAFDPAVLVDEQADGSVKVYAYFGNIQPNSFWAKLDPQDMHTIINGVTGIPDKSKTYRILNNPSRNGNHTVFEASSIRKVADGKYVYICSTNERLTALTYFYSDSPEGPWTYGGPLVDNNITWNGGNDHGSIAQCGDQWYLFYHRHTCDDFNRQGCIEPIDLRIEGGRVVIPQVEMTSQGALRDGLPTNVRYWAGTICSLKQDDVYVDGKMRCPDGLNDVVITGQQPYVGWKYFAMTGSERQIVVNVKAGKKAQGRVMVAKPGEADDSSRWQEVGKFTLKPSKTYADQKISIRPVSGKQAVFLVFDGETDVRMKEMAIVNPKQPVTRQDISEHRAAPRPVPEFAPTPIDETYFDGTWRIVPDQTFFGMAMTVRFWHENGELKMEMLETSQPQTQFTQVKELKGQRIVMTSMSGGYPLTLTIEKYRQNLAAAHYMSNFACHAERVQ